MTFSSPSASSDLKVPILAGRRGSCRHSTTSFSENVVVVEMSYQKLEVLLFCYRESREGLTTFNIDNSAIFFNEKEVRGSFPGCLFFENTRS